MTRTLRATDPFPAATVARLRRRAVFEAGKWDPQVHDGPSLAPFALRIGAEEWGSLCAAAERLWSDLARIEEALAVKPHLLRSLGLPQRARAAVASAPRSGPALRFARFDFHPTAVGWRVSEVNADVPGGFVESGPVASLVAAELGETAPPDAATAIADALAHAVPAGGRVALVHATAYADDLQVMDLFRRLLHIRGISGLPCSPEHLHWDAGGRCTLSLDSDRIDAVIRFFPAEWLANLPRSRSIRPFFGSTPQGPLLANPARALAVQSKRLGLVIDSLHAPCSEWKALMPRVRAVAPAIYSRRPIPDGWVLKPAMGRVGEGIVVPGVTAERDARRAIWHARLSPGHWLLQERFDSLPVDVDGEPCHVCIGVYTVDGRAAGAYARVARKPLIDAHAQDAVLLIDAPTPLAYPHRERNAPSAAAAVL
ncbi:MAG TPA: glutathionylspermidine synthase family protein [Phycisphaerales bacterium]|nr:glutathionylspermidine synthase family protein [Phycisphaerales bacterium]